MTITNSQPHIIDLPKFLDRRGNLSFIEQGKHVPFRIARTYWVYDVPGGETRGGHAHKALYQLIVAACGSFTVTLDDGKVKRTFLLNRPYQGLMVVPGIWTTRSGWITSPPASIENLLNRNDEQR